MGQGGDPDCILLTGVTAVAAEVLGYVQFGTIFIGGFLAAGGACLGILGLRFGRRLGGMPKEERRG